MKADDVVREPFDSRREGARRSNRGRKAAEPTCVNLAQYFPQYRVNWEADAVTKSDWPKEHWPWLMQIPCEHGLIHPYGAPG